MKRALFLPLLAAMILSGAACGADSGTAATSQEVSDQRTSVMKIGIKVGDKVITATLADNATARDFASLLPMTLRLEDYASTEKISYLPRRLSTEGAPAGIDPTIGDIAYYAPWGNLAIFYRDFRYSTGLVRLGTIDVGMEALNAPGSMAVTIELIAK